jgi:hypothetical protein
MLIIHFVSGGSKILDGRSFEQEKKYKEKIEALLLNENNYKKVLKLMGTTIGNIGSVKKVEYIERKCGQTNGGSQNPFENFTLEDALKGLFGGKHPF